MIDWKDWIAASASEADSLTSFDIAKSIMQMKRAEEEEGEGDRACEGTGRKPNVFLVEISM